MAQRALLPFAHRIPRHCDQQIDVGGEFTVIRHVEIDEHILYRVVFPARGVPNILGFDDADTPVQVGDSVGSQLQLHREHAYGVLQSLDAPTEDVAHLFALGYILYRQGGMYGGDEHVGEVFRAVGAAHTLDAAVLSNLELFHGFSGQQFATESMEILQPCTKELIDCRNE